mgnify:CR=1 FL=1
MSEKLVVETNILYSFFWKNSPTHEILKSLVSEYDLVSPEFALKELVRHKEEILFKTRVRANEFNELMELLSTFVDFIKASEYIEFIDETKALFPEHLKDVDFFALALKLNCSLWSNEKLHKKQSKVKVFNTDELHKLLEKKFASEDKSDFESKDRQSHNFRPNT